MGRVSDSNLKYHMASHKILFIARDAARALAESYFSDGRFGKDGGGADDVEIEVNGSY